MRRAIRYGRNIGLTKPFLHQTASVVFDIMKPAYPELNEAERLYHQCDPKRGSPVFGNPGFRAAGCSTTPWPNMKAKGEDKVPGDVIFKLYDTFGFPVDIVRDVVRDEEMTLDMDGFDAAMEGQRKRSRSVAAFTEIGDAYSILSAEGFTPDLWGMIRSRPVPASS